jgi:hypothetical protein
MVFSSIFVAATLEEDATRTSLFVFEVTLILIDDRLIGDTRVLVSFTSHGVRSGSGTASSKRLEGESEKRWDLMCSTALNFICIVGDSVTIHFPRKRCLFVSTTRAIQTWNQEAKKFESLKYFEVHSIQEKEPEINGHDLLSRMRRSFT